LVKSVLDGDLRTAMQARGREKEMGKEVKVIHQKFRDGSYGLAVYSR
jgi:hypothetical protein